MGDRLLLSGIREEISAVGYTLVSNATQLNFSDTERKYIIKKLDKALLDRSTGRFKLLSASFYGQIKRQELQLWCLDRAIYCLPTIELINWLHHFINGRKAIEVGAGSVSLGYYLGIPCTDSYLQHQPEIKSYYQFIGQAITNPKPDVEKLEAVEAVKKYQPQVVIASWLTQKFQQGDSKSTNASVYGCDEESLIGLVENYVHIGNENIHGDKRILTCPHQKIFDDGTLGLVSRASVPEKDAIYIFNRCDRS